MTDEELKAIEERAAKAKPGPWHPAWNRISDEVLDLGSMLIARVPDDATREFIAAVREDVPALIAEVRRLRESLTRIGWFVAPENIGRLDMVPGEVRNEVARALGGG